MKNVGKRHDVPEYDVSLRLRGKVAASLIAEALTRRHHPIELLADVIEAIARDDLWAAILDD